MKSFRSILFFLSIILAYPSIISAQTISIQENDTGFCAIDGTIMTSVAGYTGDGYADSDRGIGMSVSWSVHSLAEDTCRIKWRYANGGGTGDRLAYLLVNLDTVIIDLNFTHTGTWTNWSISDSVSVLLIPGYNDIRLVSNSIDGLANIDYIMLNSPSLEPVKCVPLYTMEITQNIDEAGTISVSPELAFYQEGTQITLRAHANPGYFFHSWSGNMTSADTSFLFNIKTNVTTRAMFYPVGTVMDTNIIGYATIQDDQGTPYMLIGGILGDTVEANTLAELQTYLISDEPFVVTVSKKIEGTGEVKIKSNKSLIGITDSAYIKGIMLQVDGAQNVIIQNLKLSHVVRWDELEITGSSRNIWIDHCDLFTDRDHDIDYYDGLLDIKNESSFITISWCRMHDHLKSSLISSGDGSVGDTVIRVTYHHNFFYNCDARLPSIRFGKAHIFNNYYLNSKDAISTRMGACVRVENNYFENIVRAVFNDQSVEIGNVHLLENHFGPAFFVTEPSCILNIPYSYESFLDATEDVPDLVGDTTVFPLMIRKKSAGIGTFSIFPNPANDEITLSLQNNSEGTIYIKIYDYSGRILKTSLVTTITAVTNKQKIPVEDLLPGNYMIEVISDLSWQSQPFIITR